jgi:hypothetical protein
MGVGPCRAEDWSSWKACNRDGWTPDGIVTPVAATDGCETCVVVLSVTCCVVIGSMRLNRSGCTPAVGDEVAGVVGVERGAEIGGSNIPEPVRRGARPAAGPVGGCLSGVGGRADSCGDSLDSNRGCGALAIRFPPTALLLLRSRDGPDGIWEVGGAGFNRPKLGSGWLLEDWFSLP